MAEFSFDSPRECPKCKASFDKAELDAKYDPVVVVHCPGCNAMLWRPGSDETSPLFPYDPDADAGGF